MKVIFAMPPPSVQLLCALRGTEYILGTGLPGVLRTRTPPHSPPPSAAAAARFPSFHIRIRGLSSRRVDDDDRGPASSEETQTDFTALNVLADSPPPATAIDACLPDGFHLGNGLKITAGGGCLLVGGEAFSWRPWLAASGTSSSMINRNGQWDVHQQAWALLDLAWPKPDLLILGLGRSTYPISPQTRKFINGMGIRVDVLDTRNAAAQFNLLATERGVGDVAAALIPLGWKEQSKAS